MPQIDRVGEARGLLEVVVVSVRVRGIELMAMSVLTGDARAERVAPWAYGWWVLVGALAGIGVAGAPTVGPAFLAPALGLAVVGLVMTRLRNRSALGILGGLAAAPLYIGWLNRGGPGQVCTVSTTGTSCVDAWSPWPFVAVGVVLLVGCVVLVRRADHQRQDH